MNLITPKRKSTEIGPDARQWIPSSFSNFFMELDHIVTACRNPFSMTLFRGHANHEWVPDSGFVRNFIKIAFEVYRHHLLSGDIRRSVAFHNAVASLLLTKFGQLHNPGIETRAGWPSPVADPWHELMVDLRRYPLKDALLPGNFLLEMTTSRDIGLYFATYEGMGSDRYIGSLDGALCIYDPVETDTSLTRPATTVNDLLELLAVPDFLDGDRTFPLLFQPPGRTAADHDSQPAPVYLAQLDFRYNLAEIWAAYEEQHNQQVFVSLLLTENTKKGVANYLETSGITEEIAYQLPEPVHANPAGYEDLTMDAGTDTHPWEPGRETAQPNRQADNGISGLIERFGDPRSRERHQPPQRSSAASDFRSWPG